MREKSASFKAWDLKEVDWSNSALAVVAQFSGNYVQASGYGAVLNLKSVGLKAASAECPFEFLEA